MTSHYHASIILLSGVIFLGCTTISPKAAHVQFHSQASQALAGCIRIAPVSAVFKKLTQTNDAVSILLREAAAEIGADSVVYLSQDQRLTEDVIHGIAYKCF